LFPHASAGGHIKVIGAVFEKLDVASLVVLSSCAKNAVFAHLIIVVTYEDDLSTR